MVVRSRCERRVHCPTGLIFSLVVFYYHSNGMLDKTRGYYKVESQEAGNALTRVLGKFSHSPQTEAAGEDDVGSTRFKSRRLRALSWQATYVPCFEDRRAY